MKTPEELYEEFWPDIIQVDDNNPVCVKGGASFSSDNIQRVGGKAFYSGLYLETQMKQAFLAGYAAAMEQITTQEKQNETTKTR